MSAQLEFFFALVGLLIAEIGAVLAYKRLPG
jgi:hypothetical protein